MSAVYIYCKVTKQCGAKYLEILLHIYDILILRSVLIFRKLILTVVYFVIIIKAVKLLYQGNYCTNYYIEVVQATFVERV